MRHLPLVAALAIAAIAPLPALAAVHSDKEAVAVVSKAIQRTPELRARVKALKKTPFLLYVENKPGELDAYYHLYAGEDQKDHTVRMWSFLVNPKTDEIKAYDPMTDKNLSWKEFLAAVRHGDM
jgi:hypothetical protein